MAEERRRGRPVAVVPARVALVALGLFEAQGFDSTSMEEISAAAGLSRRSLFNHFPTKADLAWFGFEPYTRTFCALLATAPSEENPIATIERCQLAAILDLGEDLHSVRARTRITYQHPELRSYASGGLSAIRTALQDFVVRRFGLPPGHVMSFVLADTITAQMSSAFNYWAVFTSDESPAETLHAAARALEDLVTSS